MSLTLSSWLMVNSYAKLEESYKVRGLCHVYTLLLFQLSGMLLHLPLGSLARDESNYNNHSLVFDNNLTKKSVKSTRHYNNVLFADFLHL